MPRRQATTAADWASAERQNVRVLPTGGAELAVKNLFPNPGLLELENGVSVWWEALVGPTSPNGWFVYDKWGSQNGRATVHGPLPLSQASFARDSTDYSAITYAQIGTAPSDAPALSSAPSVAPVAASGALGLAAGWYGVALWWATASEASGGLLSLPSARDAANLTLGQRIKVTDLPVPPEAPPGVYGLAVGVTAMQASESAALNATTALYVQEVYPLNSLPTEIIITGPIRTDRAGTLSTGPDPTGMDPSFLPDAPIATATSEAVPNLTGNHKIRVSWAFPDGTEGAASPQASVELTSSQTYQVTRPALAAGTCEVLLNPADRPPALAGINHNQIRYSAPAGTPQGYRISRNAPRCVVKGGSTYTLSAYLRTVGASQARLFEVIWRDANGAQIGNWQTLTTLTGTNAWNRYSVTLTAPSGAVFLEVYGHRVGSGEIYLCPPQLEPGSSATSFDNGTIPSGFSGWIIPAWDTSPVEFERHFGLPDSFSSAEVEIDDSDGFNYTVTYASSNLDPQTDPPSGWTFLSDIEDVVFRDYLAAKIVMSKP